MEPEYTSTQPLENLDDTSLAPEDEAPTLQKRVRVPVRIAGWGILGLIFLIGYLGSALWTVYSARAKVVTATPYQDETTVVGPVFNLPIPKRVNPDSWTQSVSPLKLADSRQRTGQERDQQLVSDLKHLAVTNATVPDLKIDQSTGVTTVTAGERVLATVLHEDLPEYAVKLSPAAHKSLEYQLANQWRESMHSYLMVCYMESTPGYLQKIGLCCFVLFLSAFCFHRSASLFGKYFLDSPFWSMKALIWCLWAMLTTYSIPGAEVIGTALGASMATPLLQFMVVSILVSLSTHVGSFSINRYFEALRSTQRFLSAERMELRLKTLRQAAKFLLRLVIYLVGFLLLINWWGFHWETLVTGAGLVGVAITWIGQDLFRDFLSGLNILLEDQYGVGDTIETGTTLGVVEEFTLRSTKVRSSDGALSTIPNQEIKRVKNLSTGWSQVDFKVTVSSREEGQRCLHILEEEVALIWGDFATIIQEVPQVLGLEELGPQGIVLRALIKCSTGEQYALRRELNRRIKTRFEAEKIELASVLFALRPIEGA